jgi:hypothetical protein
MLSVTLALLISRAFVALRASIALNYKVFGGNVMWTELYWAKRNLWQMPFHHLTNGDLKKNGQRKGGSLNYANAK